MTIETKFRPGDEVWWVTANNSGSGIIKNVEVNVCEHGTRTSYRVHIRERYILSSPSKNYSPPEKIGVNN